MKLLFITSSRIGDAVLSTGLLGHLIDRNPGLRATLVCSPLVAPLFRPIPEVERVLAYPKQPHGRHWLRLWPGMVRHFWDLVVNIRNTPLAHLTLHRRVASFADGEGHKVVQLGRILGLDPPPAPRLWLDAASREEAQALIPEGRPVLGLGPTANWPGKEWPPGRFVELARRLTAPEGPLPGARIAVFGAGAERPRTEGVLEGLDRASLIDLAGHTSLPVAAACLARSALYVGNDSGLMHMAAAVGTPTIGLFGPSPDALYAPWGAHARAVRTPEPQELLRKPHYQGPPGVSRLGSLTVEAVEAACADLLARTERAA